MTLQSPKPHAHQQMFYGKPYLFVYMRKNCHFFATNVFADLTGMPVSFLIENLSCEFALVNRSSKISGNLVSGRFLLVYVLELLHWLIK